MKKLMIYSLLFILAFAVQAFAEPTPYAPTPIPDRIILTIKTDPSTSMAVSWRTDTSVSTPKAQIVVANPTPKLEKDAKIFHADCRDVESDGVSARFHSVNFSGLEPKTLYAYRVGDGINWSEWFQFSTASAKVEPFSFIFLGDAQKDNKALWSRVIRQAYRTMPDAAFIMHSGDLVDGADGGGNLDLEWAEWHYAGSFINGMVPSIPTPGNHEYLNPVEPADRKLNLFWLPQFTLPENGPEGFLETTYYIDYQGLRLISLNSYEINRNDEVAKKHVSWLENVLQNNPNKWTFILFHHPIFSTAHNRDNKRLREYIKPVLEKYNVDLVLQGHDHTYARGVLPNESPKKNRRNFGPVYIVSVSGSKMYEQNSEPWWTKGGENTQLYQIVTVAEKEVVFMAYTVTGKLYDHFVLKKNPKGSKKFQEFNK